MTCVFISINQLINEFLQNVHLIKKQYYHNNVTAIFKRGSCNLFLGTGKKINVFNSAICSLE